MWDGVPSGRVLWCLVLFRFICFFYSVLRLIHLPIRILLHIQTVLALFDLLHIIFAAVTKVKVRNQDYDLAVMTISTKFFTTTNKFCTSSSKFCLTQDRFSVWSRQWPIFWLDAEDAIPPFLLIKNFSLTPRWPWEIKIDPFFKKAFRFLGNYINTIYNQHYINIQEHTRTRNNP